MARIDAKQISGFIRPSANLLADHRFTVDIDGWSTNPLGIPWSTPPTLAAVSGKLEFTTNELFGWPAGPPAVNGNADLITVGDVEEFEMAVDIALDPLQPIAAGTSKALAGFGLSGSVDLYLVGLQSDEDGSGDADVSLNYGAAGGPSTLALGFKLSAIPTIFGSTSVRLGVHIKKVSSTTFDLDITLGGNIILSAPATSDAAFGILADIAPVLTSATDDLARPHTHTFDNLSMFTSASLGSGDVAQDTLESSDFGTYTSLKATSLGSGALGAITTQDFDDSGVADWTAICSVGDALVIKSGHHKGRYRITATAVGNISCEGLESYTATPFDFDETAISWELETFGNVTSTSVFTDAEGDFVNQGVQDGDYLILRSGTSQGIFVIDTGGVAATTLTVVGTPLTSPQTGLEYDVASALNASVEGWSNTNGDGIAVAAGGKLYLSGTGTVDSQFRIFSTPNTVGRMDFGDPSGIGKAYSVEYELEFPPTPVGAAGIYNLYIGSEAVASILTSSNLGPSNKYIDCGQAHLGDEQGVTFTSRFSQAEIGLNLRENGRFRGMFSTEIFVLDNADRRIFVRSYFQGNLVNAGYYDRDILAPDGQAVLNVSLAIPYSEKAVFSINNFRVRLIPLTSVMHPKSILRVPNPSGFDGYRGQLPGYPGEELIYYKNGEALKYIWEGGNGEDDFAAHLRILSNTDAIVGDPVTSGSGTTAGNVLTDTNKYFGNSAATGEALTASTFRDTGETFTNLVAGQILKVTSGANYGEYVVASATGDTITIDTTGGNPSFPSTGTTNENWEIEAPDKHIITSGAGGDVGAYNVTNATPTTLTDDGPGHAGGAVNYETLMHGTTVRSAAGGLNTAYQGGVVPADSTVLFGDPVGQNRTRGKVASITSDTELQLTEVTRSTGVNYDLLVLSAAPGEWGTDSVIESLNLEVVAPATSLVAGNNAKRVIIPKRLDGYKLLSARAELTGIASCNAAVEIQVRNVTNSDVDMLQDKLTVRSHTRFPGSSGTGEVSSASGPRPFRINTTNELVSEGDVIAIDVDVNGSGTGSAATGLNILLEFSKE
jgi:hypothetical protein